MPTFFAIVNISKLIKSRVLTNPELECPKDKKVIKFETEYNKQVDSDLTITTLKELKNKLEEIL
jgi:hypothetical protein